MSPKPSVSKTSQNATQQMFRLQGAVQQLQGAHNVLAERFGKSLQLNGQTAHNVQQLVQAIENTSFAINRLERFTFALVKVLMDQAPVREHQYELLQTAMQQMGEVDDLEVFWGVKEPPTPEELAARAAAEAEEAEAAVIGVDESAAHDSPFQQARGKPDPFVPPGEAEQDAAMGVDVGVEGSDHSVEQVVSIDPDGTVAVVSEQVVTNGDEL